MFRSSDSAKQTIFVYLWIDFTWHAYLNRRQYIKVVQTRELPIEIRSTMPPRIFRISREYELAILDYNLAKTAVASLLSTIIVQGNYLMTLWALAHSGNSSEDGVSTSFIWFCLLFSLNVLIDLPFQFYRAFVIEKILRLKDPKIFDFFKNQLMGFGVVLIVSFCVIAIVVKTVKYTERSLFIFLWFICCAVVSLASTLYRAIVSPLPPASNFPQCELRQKIENLARELDFPLERVEILRNSSTMEEHSVVFYYGIYSKNIVLSTNIVPIPQIRYNLKDEEILALLAHQLGHWFNSHLLKKEIIFQLVLLFWFPIFFYFFQKKELYRAFGFEDTEPPVVGIIICMQYVMIPFNTLLSFASSYLFHFFEFEADAFAARLGMTQSLRTALLRIYVVSFKFPVLDKLYSVYNSQHPSLLERIDYLNSNFQLGTSSSDI